MDEQNRSDHSTNVTEMDGNVTKVNDILERLQQLLDGPIPHTIERQDIRDIITHIKQLQATIAGWSQDISNLEDQIKQLQTQLDNETQTTIDTYNHGIQWINTKHTY